MMQADVCGVGFASAAAYGLLASKPSAATEELELMKLGGDQFARVVLAALCEAKAGSWSRPPAVTYYPSDTTPSDKMFRPLLFTPFETSASTCFKDERLAGLARAAQAIIKKQLVALDCGANKEQHVSQLTRMLVTGLDGTGARSCTSHVTDRLYKLNTYASGHEALAFIRTEIANALCANAGAGSLTNDQFAAQVARLFVNAACEVKASMHL